jgi:hypothetical protein
VREEDSMRDRREGEKDRTREGEKQIKRERRE